MSLQDLHENPMMAHLVEELEQGTDIGHYGRLVFAMVARHFLVEDELIDLLSRNPQFGEEQARALVLQVNERGYNPPKPEKILEWQAQQEFPICPADDRTACNVYRHLRFPPEVYEQINAFYEEKAAAREEVA